MGGMEWLETLYRIELAARAQQITNKYAASSDCERKQC